MEAGEGPLESEIHGWVVGEDIFPKTLLKEQGSATVGSSRNSGGGG
jgi:hypothetical protein